MLLIDEVKKIIGAHKWDPIDTGGFSNVYMKIRSDENVKSIYEHEEKHDGYFLTKYQGKIMSGHYGFAIGTPIIPQWCDILDEILECCIKHDPNFMIMQIKLKYGYMCFYTYSEVIDDLHEIEALIGNTLRDEALIF